MQAAKKAARGVRRPPSRRHQDRRGLVQRRGVRRAATDPRRRHDVLAAIGRLSPRAGPSVGPGILTSLNAIAGKPLAVDPEALASGAPTAGRRVPRIVGGGPAHRRREHRRRSTRSRSRRSRRSPECASSRSASAVRTARWWRSTASRSRPRSTPELLRGVATRSGGTYFAAADADALQRVYDRIDLKLTVSGRKTEVTAVVAGVGLI